MLPLTALLLLLEGNARGRSVHHPPPERILWIGAHPDDEAYVAPILGQACVENDGRCSLLIFTRGENGSCFLPGGCSEGLGPIRAAEMSRAAALFHAHLTLWSFSDTSGEVEAAWSAEAGGRESLINGITSVVAETSPTVIYTFDPNHGSTCHPAHRAVGKLVIEAAARISPTPRVFFVETVVDFLPNDFVFRSAVPDVASIDVINTWHYLVADVAAHASQFTLEQVEALRKTPTEQRQVYLADVPAQKYSCGR